MDHYSGPKAVTSAKLLLVCQHTFPSAYASRDYCSLVDRRWRDFIHWIRAVSA
jgi:hypothetical protein